jgi:hypothetical protein
MSAIHRALPQAAAMVIATMLAMGFVQSTAAQNANSAAGTQQ